MIGDENLGLVNHVSLHWSPISKLIVEFTSSCSRPLPSCPGLVVLGCPGRRYRPVRRRHRGHWANRAQRNVRATGPPFRFRSDRRRCQSTSVTLEQMSEVPFARCRARHVSNLSPLGTRRWLGGGACQSSASSLSPGEQSVRSVFELAAVLRSLTWSRS